MKKQHIPHLCIIGAGASGLVAGIYALRHGKTKLKVCIFEQNSKVGKKILASGNGRCNVSNENINISRYHGQNPKFASYALKSFSTKDCVDFFASIGLRLTKKTNGKYFPSSMQASSISDALLREFLDLGGELKLDTKIEDIVKNEELFTLKTKDKNYSCEAVLLANGSCSMAKLGSSSSGYAFAQQFGHKLNTLYPSLVQLVCKQKAQKASGVKFEGRLKLLIDGNVEQEIYGDVLLTSYGISGSAVLDISQKASKALAQNKKVQVSIDTFSEYELSTLKNMLEKTCKNLPNKNILLLLNGFINKKLASYMLDLCKISPEKLASSINKKELNTLSFTLKNLKFSIEDTKGFENAEVAGGGVDTSLIDEKTLSSKLVDGLFFSGEVLDITGDCGGFNLHWAWASGHLAGKSLASYVI